MLRVRAIRRKGEDGERERGRVGAGSWFEAIEIVATEGKNLMENSTETWAKWTVLLLNYPAVRSSI